LTRVSATPSDPLLLGSLLALAADTFADVELRASAGRDPRHIIGEMTIISERAGSADLELVDLLSALPVPLREPLFRRTFPRRPETGSVEITVVEPGRWRFRTTLPRRYGASGAVPGRGVFANGLWHPQPIGADGAPLVVAWDAEVRLPEGAVGALNRTVGAGRLRWTGEAERLALAVVPGGRIVPLEHATLIDHGPRRARRDRRLEKSLADAPPLDLVVVEAPLRRRLSRPGPGLLYLSDRALRLSGPLWAFHRRAVVAGAVSAGLPVVDPWAREIAATAVVDALPPPPALDRLLGPLSWIPEVDQLLYNGQLPFYSDVMGETWPRDPVADDLSQLAAPRVPGRVVARRLNALEPDAAAALAASLQEGVPLAELVELDKPPWSGWQSPPLAEDLSISVAETPEGQWAITLRRRDADTAQQIPVVIDADVTRWSLESGEHTHTRVVPNRPASVAVDPSGLHLQEDLSDDRWPTPWTAVATFFPSSVSLTTGRMNAELELTIRRRHGSRWVYQAGLHTDSQDLIGATGTVHRTLGRLKDRRNRPVRLWLGAGPALLDPEYRPTDDGAVAVGFGGGASIDTRTDWLMPRAGDRISVGLGGGQALGSGARWASVGLTGVHLQPIGGRVTVAARGSGALASGDVEHRLLSLGGRGRVQGIPDGEVLGDRRGLATTELRWTAIRGASLPGPLVWGSDLQLSAGLEGGWIRSTDCVETCSVSALGWTVGAAGVGDMFGARPTMLGVWVADVWERSDGGGGEIDVLMRLTQGF